ncbi:hypothetical protein Syun_021915 [Stephania yunnanensis]|uniref:Two-component response regulator n=1 Tax=Stephania yunnanensis TaxID=152371 RepID=A0AAP0NQ48_9MAGN
MMENAQRLQVSSLNTVGSSYGSCKTDGLGSDEFPVGLRVLVVDDDTVCLKILEQMLRQCSYHVPMPFGVKLYTCELKVAEAGTISILMRSMDRDKGVGGPNTEECWVHRNWFNHLIALKLLTFLSIVAFPKLNSDPICSLTTCSQATVALNLLREKKGCFDLVISDVHMPDMDGFKLLEHVGLEMDLPVIMMSGDQRKNLVMRGIKHGACDYLLKPVRMEELRNIWQHVVRKKWSGSKDFEQSSIEENDRHKRGGDDTDYASSVNEGTDASWKTAKKRKDTKEEEEDGELEDNDPATSKKPRVVWSVELHQQFVNAVSQLGLDKAVPKRILELMNVPGLTRENVASHLQKFRLYLKRLNGVAQQQGGIPSTFYGPGDSNAKIGPLGRIDIQALAASGQIPAQTLAALQAEVLGRPTGSIVLPAMDKSALLQASLQGPKGIPVERGVTFGQPIVKSQPNISKQFPQSSILVDDIPSGYGSWPPNNLGTISTAGNGGLHTQNGGNGSIPLSQNSSYSGNNVIDYGLLSAQSVQSHSSSVGLGQVSDASYKHTGGLNGYSVPVSIPPVSSGIVHSDNGTNWHVQNSTPNLSNVNKVPGIVSNACEIEGSYGLRACDLQDQGSARSYGFVGRGTSIPSRFAMDDFESPMGNLGHVRICGNNDGDIVKQELNMDFPENAKVGVPVIQQFSPNDLMSVLSK